MTLYRQLLIVLTGLFLLIFIGTLGFGVQGTRAFLADQLASHAQDTATSLGLSLSPALEADDMATVTAMVDAIFDRGYYREIVLESVEGKPLLERRLDVRIEGVPEALVRWVPLDTPKVEALVMAGWRQAGVIRVASHPGYAYRLLWDSLLELGLWFAVIGLLAALLAGLAVRLLLRPLHAVERQAEALCRREYDVQERLPRTRELRSIVLAMNGMIARVRAMFDDQAREAERLRLQAFRDPLTGLGNRRLFEARLGAALTPEAESAGGSVALVHVEGLDELNHRRGHEAGDRLLRDIATQLGQVVPGEHDLLARIGGSDFGLILGRADEADLRGWAIRACEMIEHGLSVADEAPWRFRIGLAAFRPGESMADVLAAADEALRHVESGAPRHWALFPQGQAVEVHARQTWLEHLDRVLEAGRLVLHGQVAVDAAHPERVLHIELLARIPGIDHGLHPVGSLFPLAGHGEHAVRLDRAVVRQALAHAGGGVLAINLSERGLRDAGVIGALTEGMQRRMGGPRLAIELPESLLVAAGPELESSLAGLRAAGCLIGVDHFGRGFGSLAYLKGLHPDYVKLAHDYSPRLLDNGDQGFVVSTLVRVAHSLDIQVIAQGVETQAQWARLLELGVDGVQGYAVGKPRPL